MDLTCPRCHRVNEEASHPGKSPKPGDVSMCWGCHGIGIFTEDGIRLPTPEETAEIEADPEYVRARAAIRAAAYPDQAIGVLWGSS